MGTSDGSWAARLVTCREAALLALCCWAQTTSFVLPGALPRPQQRSDLGRPLSYSRTCQAPLDNTPWHYVTLLTRLCFVILGTGFSLPLFSLTNQNSKSRGRKPGRGTECCSLIGLGPCSPRRGRLSGETAPPSCSWARQAPRGLPGKLHPSSKMSNRTCSSGA